MNIIDSSYLQPNFAPTLGEQRLQKENQSLRHEIQNLQVLSYPNMLI